LIWADSHNSVTRTLDRQGLEDIDMRVLFRMNAGDSSSLIDTPAASLLGVFRAIFDDKGQGVTEKFRPYGLPGNEWLAWVKTQLERRCAAAR
jgi:DNA segregation ATPase FtsK/SpoIIIE, S-DNA-T family